MDTDDSPPSHSSRNLSRARPEQEVVAGVPQSGSEPFDLAPDVQSATAEEDLRRTRRLRWCLVAGRRDSDRVSRLLGVTSVIEQ
jgi:hypothetical protein